QWVREGASFSEVTRRLRERMGVTASIFPMSNEPLATEVCCSGQWLPFQDYFVRHRCEPIVSSIRLAGIDQATPLAEWFEPLQRGEYETVVICCSNPLLSIEPILQLPGVRAALSAFSGPVVAVSPLIGGKSVKGPAAKLMEE